MSLYAIKKKILDIKQVINKIYLLVFMSTVIFRSADESHIFESVFVYAAHALI